MKIIIKNFKSEYIKTISLKDLNPLDKYFLKFISVKEPLEANIYAITSSANEQSAHSIWSLSVVLMEVRAEVRYP